MDLRWTNKRIPQQCTVRELCSQLCKESWRWLQPTNQSIIIGLVDKENDIWKDDYSLNIEKTNQTIIIGLNNKTLEEDYYSLTLCSWTNQTIEDETSPTKQSSLVWTTRHLRAGNSKSKGPFDPSHVIKGEERNSIKTAIFPHHGPKWNSIISKHINSIQWNSTSGTNKIGPERRHRRNHLKGGGRYSI